MLNCAIGIVLYNRPQYTKELFKSLELNHYCELFPVYVFIDYSDRNNELLSIVKQSTLNIVEVVVNNPKLGCGKNHIALIDKIKEDDFILFEDDTIPLAVDSLNYFYSHFPQVKKEKLFSICGYSRTGTKDDIYTYDISNYFCPWGFAMTKEKWLEVKRYIFDGGRWGHCSWDVAIFTGVENKNSIFPKLGRIQNIGAEQGTHVPSSEWHRANHYVEFGAWNVEVEKKELGKWNSLS